MAFVRDFERLSHPPSRGKHPTSVTCRWGSVGANGHLMLQLNTYGSSDRQEPEKLSQTLQFDRDGAMQLKALIDLTFPDP